MESAEREARAHAAGQLRAAPHASHYTAFIKFNWIIQFCEGKL